MRTHDNINELDCFVDYIVIVHRLLTF